ncbi:MAG: hypothetical protein AAGF24_12680, partial [Cyanobacteria bacterium P01_H01_bin.121]
MLYLASILLSAHQTAQSVPAFKLLAYQESEFAWQLVEGDRWVEIPSGEISSGEISFTEEQAEQGAGEPTYTQQLGAWVLVELAADDTIVSIADATNWLLNVVEAYLSKGFKPDFLSQEADRIEQWRQNLTIQSQDIGRRTLELEARLHQIQELEERLETEKAELSSSNDESNDERS